MVLIGAVTADGLLPREPKVVLLVVGTEERTERVEAVVDTGFTGYLTLPQNTVNSLGLRRVGYETFTLADGSQKIGSLYQGAALWHGRDLYIPIGEGEPLIGMALLSGSRLTIKAEPGGEVRIEKLEE